MKNVIPFYLFFLKKRKTCTHTHSSGLHECYFYSFSHFFFCFWFEEKKSFERKSLTTTGDFSILKAPNSNRRGFPIFFFFFVARFFPLWIHFCCRYHVDERERMNKKTQLTMKVLIESRLFLNWNFAGEYLYC